MKDQQAPSERSRQTLRILQEAVRQEIEKKRRLGNYYVDWKDGHPVVVGEDAPPVDENKG